jgi:hypothetical protein
MTGVDVSIVAKPDPARQAIDAVVREHGWQYDFQGNVDIGQDSIDDALRVFRKLHVRVPEIAPLIASTKIYRSPRT